MSIKYCQISKGWFVTVCFLSCFSCGTTEKFTVSEPEISYCVFFCVMCWLFSFGVGCFVLVFCFWSCMRRNRRFCCIWFCLIFCYICLIIMAYLIFLLCQLNIIFTAVVKFLRKVFFDLQLCYIIVMSDSLMVGKVWFCLRLVFMRVLYSFISAFWADMQYFQSPELVKHALDLFMWFLSKWKLGQQNLLWHSLFQLMIMKIFFHSGLSYICQALAPSSSGNHIYCLLILLLK